MEARLCSVCRMTKQVRVTKDSGCPGPEREGGGKGLVGPRSCLGTRTPGRWAPPTVQGRLDFTLLRAQPSATAQSHLGHCRGPWILPRGGNSLATPQPRVINREE